MSERKKFSRRRFVKSSLALGAVSASGLLAACGTSSTATPATSATTARATTAPPVATTAASATTRVAATTAPAVSATTAAASAVKGEVTHWDLYVTQAPYFDNEIKLFNKLIPVLPLKK